MQFVQGLQAAEQKLKKENKSIIILWMSGGPSHIDTFGMKPGSSNAGEFKPIRPPCPVSRFASTCRPWPAR